MPRYYDYKPKPGGGPLRAPKPGPKQTLKYRQGQGYYLAPKVVKAAAKAAVARKPPTLVQQQLTEAKTIASASLNPQIASVTRERAAAEQQQLASLAASEGVIKAMGALSAGDAEASRAAYADAATRLGQYGAAFTGSMRGSIEEAAAAANAGITALDPAARTLAPDADAAANSIAFTEAYLPGRSLLEQATQGRDRMAALREISGRSLAEQGRISYFKGGADVAKIRDQVRELEAKRPGLITEALTDIRQAANAKRATDTQIGYLQLQQAKTVQERAEAMTNLTGQLHIVVGKGAKAKVVNTHKPAVGSDAVQTQIQAETSRANTAARVAQAERDRKTREENARIAAQTKLTAAQIAAQSRERIARQNREKKAVGAAKDSSTATRLWLQGATKYAREQAGVNAKIGRPIKMPPKRVKLMRSIERTWGPVIVGKHGITPAAMKKWAHDIVMAFPNEWWRKNIYGASAGASAGTAKAEGVST